MSLNLNVICNIGDWELLFAFLEFETNIYPFLIQFQTIEFKLHYGILTTLQLKLSKVYQDGSKALLLRLLESEDGQQKQEGQGPRSREFQRERQIRAGPDQQYLAKSFRVSGRSSAHQVNIEY